MYFSQPANYSYCWLTIVDIHSASDVNVLRLSKKYKNDFRPFYSGFGFVSRVRGRGKAAVWMSAYGKSPQTYLNII
jgi:hypothetical protein